MARQADISSFQPPEEIDVQDDEVSGTGEDAELPAPAEGS
jgi:hypothetical protein